MAARMVLPTLFWTLCKLARVYIGINRVATVFGAARIGFFTAFFIFRFALFVVSLVPFLALCALVAAGEQNGSQQSQ